MSQTNKVGTHKTGIYTNTGGYRSRTTKLRMNQASNQFKLSFSVYQRKGDWFVDYAGTTIPFDSEELVLYRQ